jgi:uncharacterized membrane protein YdjX (TVP38/TMEM64 family)
MKVKVYNLKKVAILALFLLVTVFIVVYFRLYDLTNIRRIVSSYGKWAPAFFMLLCVIRPIILLPIGLFSVLGGLLFGYWIGTVYTIVGSTVGSVIAYYMARYWGREWVESLLKGKMKHLDKKCRERGLTVTFLMRVIPILPCDVVSYICGFSNIKMLDYILGTFLGIIPGTFVYSYFGSSLGNMYSRQFILSVLLIVILSLIPLIVKKFSKKDISQEIGIEFEESHYNKTLDEVEKESKIV